MTIIHKLEIAPETTFGMPALPVRPRSIAKSLVVFALREPLFQFMALGLVIWFVVAYFQSLNQRYTIHIGPDQRQRLAITYQQLFSQTPTNEQLQQLTDRYVTEEIYLREGLALNLDKDDEIVRRRIAQKFEFLQTDLAVPPPPSPGVLESWYHANQARYVTPVQVAFNHVYFSADQNGDEAAKAKALAAVALLRSGGAIRAPSLGDSFPGPTDVGAMTTDAVERLFGKSELSERLFDVPAHTWAGPFKSGYGWHLIYVTDRKPPEVPRLDDIRVRVLTDWTDEQRQILNARRFEKLRSKYTVAYDEVGR